MNTYRLRYHNGLRVRRDDFVDKLIGPAWQSECTTVVSFSLPVGVDTDNSNDNVGVLCKGNGLVQKLVRVHYGSTTKAEARVAGGCQFYSVWMEQKKLTSP